MKSYLNSRQLVFISTMLLFCLACQDDIVNSEIEPVDEDMLKGTAMAESYFGSNAKAAPFSMTILKYKDGKLLFATNTDDINGYSEVNEETITANIKPGEYMFWFSGGGVTDLVGIEFDQPSQSILFDLPEETHLNQMWMVQVPESADDASLKYDILYQTKESNGATIRLDPKIKVDQEE